MDGERRDRDGMDAYEYMMQNGKSRADDSYWAVSTSSLVSVVVLGGGVLSSSRSGSRLTDIVSQQPQPGTGSRRGKEDGIPQVQEPTGFTLTSSLES